MDYEAAPDRLTWEGESKIRGAALTSIYPRDLMLRRPVWAVLLFIHISLIIHKRTGVT